MSFPSPVFAAFLVVVFVGFWRANGHSVRVRNGLLLVANLVFCASWGVETIPFLFLATAVAYGAGRLISTDTKATGRRRWLVAAIALLLLPLAAVKYAGFLVVSVAPLARVVGVALPAPPGSLLPAGISFYTFTCLSYVIDVYRGSLAPEPSYTTLSAHLSFFPTFVSGPIERGSSLLVQLRRESSLTSVALVDGFRQFLWGAVKKVVVADALAPIVAQVFSHQPEASGADLAIGAVLFSLQIYFDFSGYSEMALGVARCLGIEITRNFAHPYFSRDIAEFWRRWHVSLSSWFRDYVFFPLGANYRGRIRWAVNVLVTFALCGLWHGARWTFVVWGLVIGLYFLPLVFGEPPRKRTRVVARGRRLPTLREGLQVLRTFSLVTLAWIFFRSTDLQGAFHHVAGLFTRTYAACPVLSSMSATDGVARAVVVPALLGALVLLVEWLQRERPHPLAIDGLPPALQWAIAYALVLLLVTSGPSESVKYIYADF